ncbi:DnaA N-terminal domain-containing protein [Aneurinibacillus sp. Ricciae_BoGa-3]|uniref:DnaA N-terminal domain-containing protein n=1 Tax=Aneurinibacillus sp. Ricciae_BoGa-3 TaxID=3022697 RepID=UPI0023404AFD|nr:DnaA N-terminal domain-containing protein [Aneurinibacillus sp. Ricciae_BoGa-3]WCK54159.1 DnaA N-terminal domain-containing protein [Aneurinibacillus sp. Ricciae_BoGa-3]
MKTFEQVWREVVNRLRTKLSRPSFDAWIKELSIQSIDRDKIIIGVENEFTRQWVETRLKELLQDTLYEVSGQRYSLSFAVRVNDYVRYSMETVPPKVDPREAEEKNNQELLHDILNELRLLNHRMDRFEVELREIKTEVKKAETKKIPRPR